MASVEPRASSDTPSTPHPPLGMPSSMENQGCCGLSNYNQASSHPDPPSSRPPHPIHLPLGSHCKQLLPNLGGGRWEGWTGRLVCIKERREPLQSNFPPRISTGLRWPGTQPPDLGELPTHTGVSPEPLHQSLFPFLTESLGMGWEREGHE